MAGLLDALNSDEGMQALGLLAAAGPSATPMSFGQRLFGAMQQDQARRTEAEDRKMRQQMQQMQMQQLMEAAAGRKKAAEQEQQRASYLGAIDSSQGPPMQMSVPRALASGLSLPEIGALMPHQDPMAGFDKVSPKDYTPESLAAFMQTRNPAVLRAAPKEQAPDEFERALKLAGIDPASPMGRQLASERAKKMATHQPATSVAVQYGAPMAGKDASGKDVFFAPPKDPTKPPVIIGGVTPPNADKSTEDQSKAAGWLSQAENAYKNMLAAGFDKEGNPKAAAFPGPLDALEKAPVVGGMANALRTADRQKFIQASSSLSEALLRAATGAGVNMDEARQKVQELTPQFGERQETTRQKIAAIPQYIQSLKVRAGGAAAKMQQAPANDSDPLGIRGN